METWPGKPGPVQTNRAGRGQVGCRYGFLNGGQKLGVRAEGADADAQEKGRQNGGERVSGVVQEEHQSPGPEHLEGQGAKP